MIQMVEVVCVVESCWTWDSNSPSVWQRWGNGVIEGTELCDDGNTNSDDGCDSTWNTEIGWTCTSNNPSIWSTICRDGIVTNLEQCDDGNNIDGDGWSSTCVVESSYVWEGTPSECKIEVQVSAKEEAIGTTFQLMIGLGK